MYLRALEQLIRFSWIDSFKHFTGGELDIFSRLAMLHPIHLDDIGLPSYMERNNVMARVQESRCFTGPGNGSCQSNLLWGYDCPFTDAPMHQDHLFPYSLGGPTTGANRVILCRFHNMVKTNDIHCYPWENTEIYCEPWVDAQIHKLHSGVFSIY